MKKYGLIILIGILLLVSNVLIYMKVNSKTLPSNLIVAGSAFVCPAYAV